MASQIQISPPLAGIVRSRGFQKQPPYSCRDAVNFWPQFAIDGSETLAIRPPLDSYIAVATHPVNLLCRVNGTNSDTPQRTFVAAVNGQLKYWDGSALVNVGGSGSVATTRAVFAAAFEQKVYIPGSTNLVYDYPSDTLSTWTASSGTIPTDMRILVFWAGGLWGAAQPTAPHIVSGCATGAPLNWLFAASGEGAAFQTTGDNAGLISDPVTALIPVSGDTMIVSTPDGMQAWRGHPRRGGVADVLSMSVGVRGQGAWCQGPDGTIFALTNKGLVGISAGATTVSPISSDRIPNELIGLDYDFLAPNISMAFDNRFNGVHITVRDGADSEGWFYDLKHGGLWEQDFAQHPHVMMAFDPIETGRASGVLFGGSGGLYRHDLDGTETHSARVVLGPLRLSNNATERSKITEAQVVMGGGTTAVNAAMEFYCGPTCDSAYAAAVSGDTAAKYKTTVDRVMAAHGRIRPMIAGHAATIVYDQVSAVAQPKLVVEEINLHLEPAGKERAYVQHSDTTGPRAGVFTPPGGGLGLYASYSLDETSTPWADSGPNEHDLTEIEGTGETAAGLIDTAMRLPADAQSDYGILGYDQEVSLEVLNPEFGVTVSFWIRAEDVDNGASDRLLDIGAFGDGNEIVFEWDEGTGLQFSIGIEEGATHSVAIPIGDLWDGEWHNVMGYYDPNAAEIGVGIDNVFETDSASNIVWATGAQGGVTIRGRNNVFNNMQVDYDQIDVWSQCLNENQRADIYNDGDGLPFPYEL